MSGIKAAAYDPAGARREIEGLAVSAHKQYERHRQAVSSGQRDLGGLDASLRVTLFDAQLSLDRAAKILKAMETKK